MKPIIGMLAEVDDERSTKIQQTYINAIVSSGGIPIVLPYVEDDKTAEEFIALCSGLLFTGGADIAPARYGEDIKSTCGEIRYYRDELEFRVFGKAINSGKPILAICRGAQLVNVALGGTLYQDIPSEIRTEINHKQTEPKSLPSHKVKVIDGTPLSLLCGKSYVNANSFHHQAIKKLGANLEAMALADDGIIEAVFSTGEQYIRAYQWHPERLCGSDIDNKLIFDDFINACRIKFI